MQFFLGCEQHHVKHRNGVRNTVISQLLSAARHRTILVWYLLKMVFIKEKNLRQRKRNSSLQQTRIYKKICGVISMLKKAYITARELRYEIREREGNTAKCSLHQITWFLPALTFSLVFVLTKPMPCFIHLPSLSSFLRIPSISSNFLTLPLSLNPFTFLYVFVLCLFLIQSLNPLQFISSTLIVLALNPHPFDTIDSTSYCFLFCLIYLKYISPAFSLLL